MDWMQYTSLVKAIDEDLNEKGFTEPWLRAKMVELVIRELAKDERTKQMESGKDRRTPNRGRGGVSSDLR